MKKKVLKDVIVPEIAEALNEEAPIPFVPVTILETKKQKLARQARNRRALKRLRFGLAEAAVGTKKERGEARRTEIANRKSASVAQIVAQFPGTPPRASKKEILMQRRLEMLQAERMKATPTLAEMDAMDDGVLVGTPLPAARQQHFFEKDRAAQGLKIAPKKREARKLEDLPVGVRMKIDGEPWLEKAIRPASGLRDSGARTTFETGAVREPATGKGRFDLVPPEPLRRLAQHYENGAAKYADRNWEKGVPMGRCLNSCLRHIVDFMAGDRSEDHLAAAVWNLFTYQATEIAIVQGRVPLAMNDVPWPMSVDSKGKLELWKPGG